MWLSDLKTRTPAAILWLLCFCFTTAWTQQTPATGKDTNEYPNLPSLPGVETQIIKDDQKIPERINPLYEDWSKPTLTPGMTSEISPMGKSEDDGFTRELVHVQWRELDPIDLWVIKPTGVKNPPVILYLYSYPSSNDRYSNAEFCRFLTKDGFAAVGFVSAITGQRIHDRPRRDWFVNQLQEALGASVHDVQMILNYLGTRGDLDMGRVGMWGDGSGASIAIMAAAVDPRIKALDLLDPWGDWPVWLAGSSLIPEKERESYLKPGFLKTVENLDPLKLMPSLKTPQVRLQHIMQGITVTPDVVRKQMEAAAPASVKVVHYENTKAFIADVGSTGRGFDWIKEQLGPAAEGQRSGNLTKAASESKNSSR